MVAVGCKNGFNKFIKINFNDHSKVTENIYSLDVSRQFKKDFKDILISFFSFTNLK